MPIFYTCKCTTGENKERKNFTIKFSYLKFLTVVGIALFLFFCMDSFIGIFKAVTYNIEQTSERYTLYWLRIP